MEALGVISPSAAYEEVRLLNPALGPRVRCHLFATESYCLGMRSRWPAWITLLFRPFAVLIASTVVP